jgi:hypothetical protein
VSSRGRLDRTSPGLHSLALTDGGISASVEYGVGLSRARRAAAPAHARRLSQALARLWDR